jgi:uncharacterized membrane protein YfcA
VSRVRAGALAGLGLMVALGATLGPAPGPGSEPGASLVVRIPDAIAMLVVGLLALSFALFLSLQRRPRPSEDELAITRERTRPRRRAAMVALPFLLLLAAIACFTWARWAPDGGHPLEAPLAALAGLLDLLAHARKPPTSVPVFDYAMNALILLVALATFLLMLFVVFAERLLRWRTRGRPQARPLVAAVEESLEDLRAQRDVRAAIITAYRRFELALAAARLPRAAWQTPAEFMRAALTQVAVPAPAVRRLTTLFELARFSDRPLGVEARDDACDCLDAVRAALDTEPPRAR